ncbi:MAG: winged helix DNA-binding domain-containing protein, partial [Bifidobacteriaceae bacterium]|nr:winged helix DNA-binding domain-containing protein [Bifidobacteriaceae bacterium]
MLHCRDLLGLRLRSLLLADRTDRSVGSASPADAADPGSPAEPANATDPADATDPLCDAHLTSATNRVGRAGGARHPPPRSPAGVVRHFLAAQAQDFPASQWALGLRSGVGLADVERAYLDGQVVRSWPMRGTLHAVAADDVGWLQRLTSAKVLGASAERRRQHLGLDARHIERVRECAIGVLAGGRALARGTLFGEVAARGIEVSDPWKYRLIWFFAQTGTLVFGPVADGEPLLVLAEEWIAHPRNLDREEGLAELAARYVASHGPACLDDLSWWSGLGKREVREGLALAGDRVVRFDGDDGTTYWMSPELADAAGAGPPSAGVALLPAFDEHLLGYRDRTAMLAPGHAASICPGGNGVFRPVVVVDGVCAGTWRAAPRG